MFDAMFQSVNEGISGITTDLQTAILALLSIIVIMFGFHKIIELLVQGTGTSSDDFLSQSDDDEDDDRY